MKKVFLIHGFEGRPNGGWRPWLMAELEKQGVYACALPMPTPELPRCFEWVSVVKEAIDRCPQDDIYLVGHSLGVPAILRYLESGDTRAIAGAVLVAGPCQRTRERKIDEFFEKPFSFSAIRKRCQRFTIIHGSDDPNVPMTHAEELQSALSGQLIIVEGGKHLNGDAGYYSLPQCIKALEQMMA